MRNLRVLSHLLVKLAIKELDIALLGHLSSAGGDKVGLQMRNWILQSYKRLAIQMLEATSTSLRNQTNLKLSRLGIDITELSHIRNSIRLDGSDNKLQITASTD